MAGRGIFCALISRSCRRKGVLFLFTTVYSGAFVGMECYPVRVEVDVAPGLPCMEMIGCLSREASEARERIRVALKNMEIVLPPSRITINLSPADRHKSGTAFDLPVAMGLLASIDKVCAKSLKGVLFLGELGLDGSIRPVNGILPMVRMAAKEGIGICVVPKENAEEAAVIDEVAVYGASHLSMVIESFKEGGEIVLPRFLPEEYASGGGDIPDFADVKGAESVRRAMEVAAAGFHHILMIGPPGSGKTMIASRVPGILPPLSKEESLESSAVYSICGRLPNGRILTRRPFVSPHHSSPGHALVGGGRIPVPGAVSLAHKGVLFLDELTEFKRNVLDMLRQPMEDRKVMISRVYGAAQYPADFMLVAATNPCPCGYYPNRQKCRCTETEIRKYLSRISGPLLDRIDIGVEVPDMKIDHFMDAKRAESSERMRERIMRARQIQASRFSVGGGPAYFNARMGVDEIEEYCPLSDSDRDMLRTLFARFGLSARAYHKILRVARTIADLAGDSDIATKHLQEAVFYRTSMRKYWGSRG